MKKIDINVTLIKDYLNEHNLTVKEFCEKCEIKYYAYRQLMLGDANISVETLYRIGYITKIRMEDLINY